MSSKRTPNQAESKFTLLKALVMFIGDVAGVLSLMGPGRVFGNVYFCPPEGDVVYKFTSSGKSKQGGYLSAAS